MAPNHSETQFAMADFLYRNGKFTEAAKYCLIALELNNTNKNARDLTNKLMAVLHVP
jgi:hypothetical protein